MVLSRNFDWFTVGEGDKLLVATLLATPIARTTPSVLLVGQYFILGCRPTTSELGKL